MTHAVAVGRVHSAQCCSQICCCVRKWLLVMGSSWPRCADCSQCVGARPWLLSRIQTVRCEAIVLVLHVKEVSPACLHAAASNIYTASVFQSIFNLTDACPPHSVCYNWPMSTPWRWIKESAKRGRVRYISYKRAINVPSDLIHTAAYNAITAACLDLSYMLERFYTPILTLLHASLRWDYWFHGRRPLLCRQMFSDDVHLSVDWLLCWCLSDMPDSHLAYLHFSTITFSCIVCWCGRVNICTQLLMYEKQTTLREAVFYPWTTWCQKVGRRSWPGRSTSICALVTSIILQHTLLTLTTHIITSHW